MYNFLHTSPQFKHLFFTYSSSITYLFINLLTQSKEWKSHSHFFSVSLLIRSLNQVAKLNSDFTNLLKLEMEQTRISWYLDLIVILLDYQCELIVYIFNAIKISHFL